MTTLKHKPLFLMIIFVTLFLLCGGFFIINLHQTLLNHKTEKLRQVTEQGSFAIHTEILDSLNNMIEFSHQSVFCQQSTDEEKIQALSQKIKTKRFDSVIYAKLSGSAVTDEGKHLSLADEPYFKKAISGIPNISSQPQASNQNQSIIFSVPVIDKNCVTGVLIASLSDIEKFQLTRGIVNNNANYICLLKSDGTILSSNFSDVNGVLFTHLQNNGDENALQKIKANFQVGMPGVSTFSVDQTPMLLSYTGINGTDGWIFLVAADYDAIFAHANRVFLLSTILFVILITAFFLTSFYVYKFKRFSYETKVRNKEQKKYFTFFDALTNLPNRKGMIQQFDSWIDRCYKESQNGGALFLDIDNLQSINHTFGHDIGDELLCEAATRLKKYVDGHGIVGRIGSDEFTILMCGVNTENKLKFLVKKIIKIFCEPYVMNGIVIQLSCSVGAMLIFYDENYQKESVRFEDILGKGEFVLNEAKQTRKGSYVLFNKDYEKRVEQQFQLDRALKFSIDNEEIFCYFQPQYNCMSKTIIGFETLARWESPVFGTISPARFIPMAEKSGFIKELGRYIIENAFAFAKTLEGRRITVSLNASPMELLDTNYVDYIISRYQYYGLTPNSIAIEITESCLIESFEKVTKELQLLERYGIQIYLDDFGTGYSSLNYLKNLPINTVKIDKSFIDEIVTNDVEQDIVHMIISLARRLHLKIIAEGVETEDQMRCVLQAGCHLIQGYLISKPVAQDEALLLLSQPKQKIDHVTAKNN